MKYIFWNYWTQVLLALSLMTSAHAAGKAPPDLFGLYTSDLSGRNFSTVITSSWQQMTHPRVSPDGQWVTFTRYRETGLGGFAQEKNGYQFTEIMLVRLDGAELKTIIPAKPGILNCNSAWSPDGQSLIWLSTDNPQRQPQLMRIALASGKITRIPTPPQINASDPHVVGTQIVFPSVTQDLNTLWIMQLNGSGARQLSFPKFPPGLPRGKFAPGDYDPKLAPDGREVAFMRLFGIEAWRILIVDIATGRERDLSGSAHIDTLPDWSSDGELLLFWHVNRAQLATTGLYTMHPDGSARRMIPVPRGYLHGHPSFFPHSGSNQDARIIFQAVREPKLP